MVRRTNGTIIASTYVENDDTDVKLAKINEGDKNPELEQEQVANLSYTDDDKRIYEETIAKRLLGAEMYLNGPVAADIYSRFRVAIRVHLD